MLGVHGDGRTDFVVTSGCSQIEIFLHNTLDGFEPHGAWSPAGRPMSLAAADVDRDGHMDLVVGLSAPSALQVFFGDGTGALEPGSITDAPITPGRLVLRDLDGDGAPDVALISLSQEAVYLLTGDGAGGFLPAGSFPCVDGEASMIAAADTDEDGNPDLMVGARWLPWNLRLYLGHGDGTFTPDLAITPFHRVGALALQDFDADSHTDLLTVPAEETETDGSISSWPAKRTI